MKFRINNLGVIRNANVELTKKLTVFCGPNSSGKTYLSYIIYALVSSNRKPFNVDLDKSIPKEDINKLIERKSIEMEIVPKEVLSHKNALVAYILRNLDSIFGISDEKVRLLFKDFNLQFIPSEEECAIRIQNLEFSCKMNIGSLAFTVVKELGFKVSIEPDEVNNYSEEQMMPVMGALIYMGVLGLITTYPILGASIFPVERMSIYTFNKELSINRHMLIDQVQRLAKNQRINPFEFINQRSKRYPLVISQGLEVANDLVEIQKKEGPYFKLAEEIEQEILDGKVSATKDGDVVFVSNKAGRSKKMQMPIHMTASIIKSLSSLIFHLKYLAQEDDLIIIDEPEMNLHPNSQIILVQIFGKLLNRGLKLLISTHSDYVIRELNNLIMAYSAKQKNTISGNIYCDDIVINKDDINVYYFPFRTKRHVDVQKISVSEYGFAIPSIDKTINEQNLVAENLFFDLKYNDNERQL